MVDAARGWKKRRAETPPQPARNSGGNAMTPISMDGTDPAGWDPSLDSLAAAPANHRLLYEDESIRVLSVSIAPGQTEPPHHHRWPSVFVIDRFGKKMRDFDSDGREIPLPLPERFELPLTVNMPPQPVHYVRNEDTIGFHGTRIEFKRGFPSWGQRKLT
jgi:hypothetical protein